MPSSTLYDRMMGAPQESAQRNPDQAPAEQPSTAGELVDDLADVEMATARKEFVFGIFIPSLITLPVLSLFIWYFYWFITKVKDVPPAFEFRRAQQITLIAATLLTLLLALILFMYVSAVLCTGVTGVVVRSLSFIKNLGDTDAGINGYCHQFKDVISEFAQYF